MTYPSTPSIDNGGMLGVHPVFACMSLTPSSPHLVHIHRCGGTNRKLTKHSTRLVHSSRAASLPVAPYSASCFLSAQNLRAPSCCLACYCTPYILYSCASQPQPPPCACDKRCRTTVDSACMQVSIYRLPLGARICHRAASVFGAWLAIYWSTDPSLSRAMHWLST